MNSNTCNVTLEDVRIVLRERAGGLHRTMAYNLIPNLADELRGMLKDREVAWQVRVHARAVEAEANRQAKAWEEKVQSISRLLELYGVDAEAIHNAHNEEVKTNGN